MVIADFQGPTASNAEPGQHDGPRIWPFFPMTDQKN